MITYLKMKHAEHKIKLAVYSSILSAVSNQKPIFEFCQNLYAATKNVSNEEFQAAIVSALAALIHEENNKTD